jgi:hypothetical protein
MDLKGNLYKLWNRLSSGSYFPPPVRAVEIPKRSGGSRVLGVPTVADRIAETVVAGYVEPEVEPHFHPDSYRYRPGRSALDAVGACRERCWREDWVVDLDLMSFFDSVPHDLVLRAVACPTAGRWEPDDGRLSRPVLRAPGGAPPPGDLPPGEPAGSLRRTGFENGHRIHHAKCVRPDVVTPTRSRGRLRDRAAAFRSCRAFVRYLRMPQTRQRDGRPDPAPHAGARPSNRLHRGTSDYERASSTAPRMSGATDSGR